MGTVKLEIEEGLATLLLERKHGNAINGALVDDLTQLCGEVGRDPAIRGVMLAGAGKLFCPGLDLQELIELDRGAMEDFLGRFNGCIRALYTLEKPVVARMHGHAVAGGCVLSLTADWRVLREGVLVGLNELKVGVPFPYGVAMILRESAPSPKVEEVALFGRNYSGEEAIAAGLAHEVCSDGLFEARCRERLAELAERDAGAFAASKRYLRSPVVERIERFERSSMGDFLDGWFSEATRGKVQAVVDQLRSK
jgi:enoyl-CoA hydratase/carnithine racemase